MSHCWIRNNKPPPERPETNNPNPQNFPANCYVFVTETAPNTAKTVLKWGVYAFPTTLPAIITLKENNMHQPVHPTRPNLRLFVCRPPRTLLQSALGYPTRYLLWSDRDLSTEPHYAPVVCLTRWGARRVAARNTLNTPRPTANQPTN